MRLIFRKDVRGHVFVVFPFERYRDYDACMTFSVEGRGVIAYDCLYEYTYPAKPTADRKLLGYVMAWDDIEILDDLPPIEQVKAKKFDYVTDEKDEKESV